MATAEVDLIQAGSVPEVSVEPPEGLEVAGLMGLVVAVLAVVVLEEAGNQPVFKMQIRYSATLPYQHHKAKDTGMNNEQ
jgi:hypothetical protein